MRRGPLVAMSIALAALMLTGPAHPSISIVYNASPSAPLGWYRVVPPAALGVGDNVITRLPRDVASFADQRQYLPRSVPALKRIVAVTGQEVCIRNTVVYVNRQPVARTLDVDAMGRPMPAWKHCRRLVSGELFLLNTGNAASFDSRYFGPIDASFVIGRAIALWTSQTQ